MEITPFTSFTLGIYLRTRQTKTIMNREKQQRKLKNTRNSKQLGNEKERNQFTIQNVFHFS